jgi:outer membrane protein assembly factor BamB
MVKPDPRPDTSHVIADGAVYFGSYDGYLYAVDIKTVTEKWRFEERIRAGCVPKIVKDVLYIQGEDSNLYCLDIETGMAKWNFKIKGKFTSSMAVYKDVIYFGGGGVSP